LIVAAPIYRITVFDSNSYLARIRLSGPTHPSPETLRQLHLAHLYAVPFENLDISLGRKIVCDEDRFFQKIVQQRRGGFCYELNGAFAALLRDLGFSVTLLSARVSRADGSASAEFDHLALRVDLDERWLADVGFGDSFLEPLRLKPEIEQEQGSHRFRIVNVRGVMIVQRQDGNGLWKSQYQFTQTPRQLSDFADRCEYQQVSPESHFTRQRICTLPVPNGRITLSDLKLIRTTGPQRHERVLRDEDEWRAMLAEYFGVSL
jgi:N-hydroxyarylamine O-acetyltransferase